MSYDIRHGHPTKTTFAEGDTILIKDKNGTIHQATVEVYKNLDVIVDGTNFSHIMVIDANGNQKKALGVSDTFAVGTETLTFIKGILTKVETT